MTKPIDIQVWDAVLAELNRLLEQPTDAIPSVQVLTETNLRNCLRIAKDAVAGAKSWTIVRLLDLLKQSGLGSPIPLDGLQDKVPAVRLWRIGFGAMPVPDALELLQAAKPQGIVCYFSALSHHELTTQEPSHHHIALFRRKAPAELSVVVTPPSGKVPSLGSFLFSHASLPYYWTNRLASMVPGVERVYFSDKAVIRVTTLEQTLLDTLHRPWSCGGPSVVFEAWERGVKRLEEERLLHCLESINHPLLTRRTGCMLERCGHRIADARLAQFLARAKADSASAPVAFFLPAVPGNRTDPAWRLEILE